MDSSSSLFYLLISYLQVWCPVAAFLISLFRSRLFGQFDFSKFAEQLLLQLLFWAVGVECLIIFILFMWFPHVAGSYTNLVLSRFSYDLSMVNLSFAVLGFASLLSSLGFRTATALGYSIWIFGDGLGHLNNILAGISSPPHVKSMFYSDLVVPLVIIVTLLVVNQKYKSKT